jgi:DNA mismatch repair protein MutL
MADGTSIQRIHKLPDSLINKIAAGEVIERPASVVKELLENSLDAGATRININIRNGGSRLVRVEDNGHGIHPDDLLLAVDRHTTSKIHSDADLWQIRTLGFRGEALSSIAAVSRFTLTTKQKDSAHGWSAKFHGHDAAPVVQPAAHHSGTTIEVCDLFYNTPARRKFLRSERTEFIHIQELVKRIALSRFNLSIRMTHNDRQVFRVTGDEQHLLQRVGAVMGRAFQAHSVMIDQQAEHMKLYGWLGQPEAARSQTDQQYFYLNGRMIKDRLINHAVRLAFQGRLYSGRQPVYLLYLDTDAAAVDINVHPAKQEVRFRDARSVHDFIYGTLHRALSDQTETMHDNSRMLENPVRENRSDYRYSVNRPAVSGAASNTAASSISIGGRYLILQAPDAATVIDVYRAREWTTCLRLKDEWAAGKIRKRPVLVPLTCQVTVVEADLLELHQPLLEKLGFVVQRSSATGLLIREIPLLLSGADALATVRDVLAVLKENENTGEQIEMLLGALSRRANDGVSAQPASAEINALLTELEKIKSRLTPDEYKSILRRLDMQSLHDLLND